MPATLPNASTTADIAAFITRWQHASGSERANYQLFITELCELLGVPKPDPARARTALRSPTCTTPPPR